MSSNLDKICETLSALTVLELSELSKMLEGKWGVTASIALSSAPATAAASGEAATAEVKDKFNVILKVVGDNKINVIKEVRAITGLGLKEAKDLVEAAQLAPKTVKEAVAKDAAEDIKNKLEAVGAKVELA